MNDSFRWGLIIAGLLILGGDIYGDLQFFGPASARTGALLGAAIVRNLLLVAALVGLAIKADWARFAVIATLAFGVVRRGMFFAGLGPLNPEWIAMIHAGADTLFRLLLVFALLALFSRGFGSDEG